MHRNDVAPFAFASEYLLLLIVFSCISRGEIPVPTSNVVIRKRKKETCTKKGAWSHAEEQVLLCGLKRLVVTGMKSDNGFKAGYMTRLESTILDAFPDTDIRAKPHIESKLSTWKKTYAQLCDILGKTGFGFNVKGDFKIDADIAVWEELIRSDQILNKYRDTPWPYFETWKEVFGKDRATGDGAAEFSDMYNDLVQETQMPSNAAQGDEYEIPIDIDIDEPPVFATPTNPTPDDSMGQSTSEANVTRRSGKKKVAYEECFHSLVDLVGNIEKANSAKVEVFQKIFARQAEVNNARSAVWSMLEAIPGMSDDDMYVVGEKLLRSSECLELFMNMKVDKRPGYIARLKEM